MTLVDANVLLDLFTADAAWKDWSREHLKDAILDGGGAINPIIYAEVSLAIAKLPLPYGAGFLAGRAYLRYRRRGGERRSPLPDSYIGAHAQVDGLALLTRDPDRYRSYFPSVTLVSPES